MTTSSITIQNLFFSAIFNSSIVLFVQLLASELIFSSRLWIMFKCLSVDLYAACTIAYLPFTRLNDCYLTISEFKNFRCYNQNIFCRPTNVWCRILLFTFRVSAIQEIKGWTKSFISAAFQFFFMDPFNYNFEV